jgi:formimidoylglutamate deiminase
LWGDSLFGGARAAGASIGALDGGSRADWIVLDDEAPVLAARDSRSVIDSFVFSGNANLVRDVMVAGEWVVRGGHHRDEQRIAARYRDAVTGLE